MSGIDGNWAEAEVRADQLAERHDRDLPDLADVIDRPISIPSARAFAENAHIGDGPHSRQAHLDRLDAAADARHEARRTT